MKPTEFSDLLENLIIEDEQSQLENNAELIWIEGALNEYGINITLSRSVQVESVDSVVIHSYNDEGGIEADINDKERAILLEKVIAIFPEREEINEWDLPSPQYGF